MKIDYTYEIVSVDKEALSMEIAYSSPGRQTINVIARLPNEGETLGTVINMFSPVTVWRDMDAESSTHTGGHPGASARREDSTDAIWVIPEARNMTAIGADESREVYTSPTVTL